MGNIDRSLECYFVMTAGVFGAILIIIAAIITPNYSPLTNTISELGYFQYKTLFSIAMVIIGNSMIPFFFKLERELTSIEESLRIIATAAAVFTAICISLVGVIPDLEYLNQFLLFHALVAVIAFGGSSIYILLYSRLIQKAIAMPSYKGPPFRRFLSYFGYSIFIVFILLMILFIPIIEWLMFILIVVWNVATAYYLSKYKFSGLAGLYYTKDQFPEMLNHFTESLEILKSLNLEDSPEAESLKNNISFLKDALNNNK
ncbi:MAG: DUF998 domain-containing protein [Promethearchaeota archaeon]|nr:MAG: DUF998 domain-containing protein [Candidatus Lokiarchaeota archaeon]